MWRPYRHVLSGRDNGKSTLIRERAMLLHLLVFICLPPISVSLAVTEMSYEKPDTEISMLETFDLEDLEEKAAIKLPSLSDLFGSFDMCLLSCKGRACGCCNRLLNLVKVCGSSYVDPTERTLEINLNIAGRRIYKIITPLDRLEHLCQNMKLDNIGEVDLCVNTSLSALKNHADSFRVCAEAEVQLNRVRILVVSISCLEFKGDVIFEGEDTPDGKRLASVRILNPVLLANEIRKIVTQQIFGK